MSAGVGVRGLSCRMEKRLERLVAREAKAMTRDEVVGKAFAGKLTWLQAADILGVTGRQMRRIKRAVESRGVAALRDGRAGNQRRRRISAAAVEQVIQLKRDVYPDFSIQHFYEFATEKHRLELSYTTCRTVLIANGLVEKAPGRGQYRRKRERRPMRGMLMHLDASTHEWLEGQPMQDLIVMLDDADGRILYARFVPQEGTVSTLEAFEHVLTRYGRFCELYTDRGSHFCVTTKAAEGPDAVQTTQVARVLKALGIRHILARSPQARGRSERAFGTIQGRLPQELRLAGVTTYAEANKYLTQRFIPAFNRKFTVTPVESESAFTPLVGLDLKLLLAVQHERTVRPDNTVAFGELALQLPRGADRVHYARCPVLVHELLDQTLAVTYQGQVVGRFNRNGELLPASPKKRVAAA
jgi:hypothetical protein